jgi:predicted transcriptional regulator
MELLTGYEELIQILDGLPTLVRETRRRKRLGVNDAAKDAGVPASVLSRVENGKAQPALPTVIALLKWASK